MLHPNPLRLRADRYDPHHDAKDCKTGAAHLVLFMIIAAMATSCTPVEAARPVVSLLEMRREHVVVQEWDLSCGAAALATLLNFQHNDPISEREVAMGLMAREDYIQNPNLLRERQGFSLLDLKRFVEQRGYEGIGFGKMELEDLIERSPVMVPINTNGYNHFVIFRGGVGNRVLLADPAWGNRTMTIEHFERIWLDYPEFGHVGFVAARKGGEQAPSRMAPRSDDFVMLR